MQGKDNIIDCYNKTAAAYAEKYLDELSHKHLDRILLSAFAVANKEEGRMIDLGCGPGQTTQFLYNSGVWNIVGTDISPAMIGVAKVHAPDIPFETADMLQLPYENNSFASAIAFYAIVHFDNSALRQFFKEVKRVLQPGGQFLFSFHAGNETIHMDNFLGSEVDIDFCFFEVEKILTMLEEEGYKLTDRICRKAYASEYPSERAYVWVSS